MKKYKFYFSTGYVNCAREEIMEFEDDATEEEVKEAFMDWLWERSDANWWEIDE